MKLVTGDREKFWTHRAELRSFEIPPACGRDPWGTLGVVLARTVVRDPTPCRATAPSLAGYGSLNLITAARRRIKRGERVAHGWWGDTW